MLFYKINEIPVPIPGKNPIDNFGMMVDIGFLDEIVRKTNKYAVDLFFNCQELRVNSRVNKWKELTVNELKLF